jgi:hypothetical protein
LVQRLIGILDEEFADLGSPAGERNGKRESSRA